MATKKKDVEPEYAKAVVERARRLMKDAEKAVNKDGEVFVAGCDCVAADVYRACKLILDE